MNPSPINASPIFETEESALSAPLSFGAEAAPEALSEARAAIARLRAGEAPSPGALDLSGLRLIGEDLAGLDLSAADLRGADLSRANLEQTNLFGARLAGTVLFEANLSAAELSGADLEGANLESACLKRAGLGHANLRGASLVSADLEGATLTEADLTGADLRSADLRGVRAREADLSGADLTRASCAGAEFDDCKVAGATFDKVDLRGASVSGLRGFNRASWIGVDMRDIDFTGAYLCRRFAMDQNFIDEFRRQSRATRLAYHVWSVTSDCGRSVVRWSTCTLVIVVLFAWLYTLVGVDYGEHETALSPLYFSVVTLTTLGYGDVLPASMAAQVVAMCEVVFGYVMLGGLLSLFTNKMASRAD